MKKPFFLAFAFLLTQTLIAQQQAETLKKELISINAGFLGSWINYERQVGELLSINGQIGFDGGFYGGSNDFNYVFVPTISVEPRFYYNFNKRVAKSKKTFNNSANYIALTTTLIPDLFKITNDDTPNSRDIEKAFQLVPKWGLRRPIGKNFKFDFALGYGLAFSENGTHGQLGLDLKIGYVFYKK